MIRIRSCKYIFYKTQNRLVTFALLLDKFPLIIFYILLSSSITIIYLPLSNWTNYCCVFADDKYHIMIISRLLNTICSIIMKSREECDTKNKYNIVIKLGKKKKKGNISSIIIIINVSLKNICCGGYLLHYLWGSVCNYLLITKQQQQSS